MSSIHYLSLPGRPVVYCREDLLLTLLMLCQYRLAQTAGHLQQCAWSITLMVPRASWGQGD